MNFIVSGIGIPGGGVACSMIFVFFSGIGIPKDGVTFFQ